MNIEQMRKAVTEAYSGADWPYKVMKMPDAQVAAIYQRMLDKQQSRSKVQGKY